jgi:hypothetical protein
LPQTRAMVGKSPTAPGGEFVVAVRLRPVGGARAAELFTRLVTGSTGPTFVSAPGQGVTEGLGQEGGLCIQGWQVLFQ